MMELLSQEELAFCREVQEASMIDFCRVLRTTSGGGVDEATGTPLNTHEIVYEGKCRAMELDYLNSRQGAAGDLDSAEAKYALLLPWEVVEVTRDDRVKVESINDPRFHNIVLTIRSVNASTYLTARRMMCGVEQNYFDWPTL